MSFSSMAINNIRKKAGMYLIYYLSTTFAVTIYFIFSAIYYNPSFANMHTGVSKMGIIFQVSSLAVILFAAVFVYFANMLFLKTRKKEFAIYFLLGVRKREIGQILVTEIGLVGLASIMSGVVLGSIFARFFALILKKLILGGAPGHDIVFHLTWQPAVASLVVFTVLFAINAIYSVIVINKSSLLELLSAEKEGDKEPKFSAVSAALSIMMIGASYAIFLSFSGDQGAMKLLKPALFSCALLAVGTYLLFQNVVIWFVSKCKKNISFYYRINNFISISQIVYRIKTNANLFCVIALSSAFTMTVMSAAISLYQSLHDAMPIYAPFSYICHEIDDDMKERVATCITNDETAKLYAITDFDVLTTMAQLDGYKVDTNNASGKTILEVGEEFNEYHQILYNMYGAYIFIGMFLGILFLLAAGSIIFYKQMMEARDDIGRYEILRKIGMSYKEVRMSISKQIGIIFLLPFTVALCHALVTLKMYENMMYTIKTDSAVFIYALGVVLIYSVIYLLFYVLSVKGYMNTIWRKVCTE